ncbi:trypsin-like serine protease [Polynucleobacter paneuropaeus]|uniref:trypsin-like peptidase domain-containing protein n=1 Tax=Polynucleobacter paneuropaeus TaxID=2527775 RepID=UPI001BFEAA28|nr:trypsin-like peptidase domain-containing protein [Polynucleobacter paneuropaeus]MBT8568527.1 trypsin-like serine protease [Polynucleobacter paneuropaeus]MBT8630972.1 trypsin-like serine protease [Polynucleobacter paneuropaeus]QWD39156.1 trypsin-like serine protease [Polynucleobacter paneuropaeus]
MLNRLWLLFAQAVTILIAVWFVLITLKPEWLAGTNVTTIVDSVTLKESDDVSSPNPGSYHEAVKKSMPAVVNIFTSKSTKQPLARKDKNKKSDPFNQFFFGDTPDAEPISSLGSGVIVSPEGVILTNHHVISDADEIEIALADGRKLKAKIIGSDPETDIAVLKIDAKQLPNPITLGNVNSVHVGDVVLAIGNPFGVGETVTSGIVSAMGRDHVGINTFENFIQTDAAINPGNSGGALIDTRGNLIGINTAIYSNNGGSMGIGFAIPINLAKQVMESILKTGSVTRGWIGVEPQNLTSELINSLGLPTDTKGVLLSGVLEGGPADAVGVKVGDVLIEVNNQNIEDVKQLLTQVAALSPGTKSTVKVSRKNKVLTLYIEVGKRPKQKS